MQYFLYSSSFLLASQFFNISFIFAFFPFHIDILEHFLKRNLFFLNLSLGLILLLNDALYYLLYNSKLMVLGTSK